MNQCVNSCNSINIVFPHPNLFRIQIVFVLLYYLYEKTRTFVSIRVNYFKLNCFSLQPFRFSSSGGI